MKSVLPPFDPADRRLDPAPDDAATALPATVVVPVCDLRRDPHLECGLDTQLLFGAAVRILSRGGDWLRLQSIADGYVGWTLAAGVSQAGFDPTHVVCAPRSFVYPGPDLRFPQTMTLSMGSQVSVESSAQTRGTDYAVLVGGSAMIASHLRPMQHHDPDPVEAARRLLGTPYLWGGSSAFGIDCSGLVQLAMRMCGRFVLRDSDMQASTLGSPIEPGADFSDLKRGDLVFWKGHAGIAEGDGMLLHASGHAMLVVSENLAGALERIERRYARPLAFRRP